MAGRGRPKKYPNGYKAARREELLQYYRDYRVNNLEHIQKTKKEYMDNIKLEGIAAYGGKCSCCGETIPEFLTIEHLEGRPDGEKRLTGKKMWLKAKSEGYPDKYTVLCFNCNCAKGAFGVCPHQKVKN